MRATTLARLFVAVAAGLASAPAGVRAQAPASPVPAAGRPAPARAAPPAAQPPAQPAAPPPAPPAGGAERAADPPRAPTAIGRVAEGLAAALSPGLPRPALVVPAPLTSDVAAPKGAELARTVASLVAGALGLSASPEPRTFEEARSAARAHRALVYVRPAIEGGKLRATADVVPTPRSRWARLRDPAPAPVAHAFAEAPIDAEVRAHLVPVPLTALAPTRGRAFESGIVALACDDLDGDGAAEIVSVSRSRIVLLRLRAGKVVPVFAKTWSELSAVAPAPLREPIGFATSVPALRAGDDPAARPRDVVVALTDRAESVRLDARLEVVERYPKLAVPDGDGFACAQTMGHFVTGPLASCGPGAPAPRAPSIGGRYDAFASAPLVRADGGVSLVWAGREEGTLELRDERSGQLRVPGVGAQLAVGDLDQDGGVEILASLDVDRPEADAVIVRSWSGAGPARELFRMPAGAGVSALAICPPDGPGRQPFVVATAGEIVVVR